MARPPRHRTAYQRGLPLSRHAQGPSALARIRARALGFSKLISYGGVALLGWHSGSLASLFNWFAAENEPAKEQHIGKNQQRGYRGYGIADFVS